MTETVVAARGQGQRRIRAAAEAVAMLDAGATRLGLSGTRAVLDGLSADALVVEDSRSRDPWCRRQRNSGVLGGGGALHAGST